VRVKGACGIVAGHGHGVRHHPRQADGGIREPNRFVNSTPRSVDAVVRSGGGRLAIPPDLFDLFFEAIRIQLEKPIDEVEDRPAFSCARSLRVCTEDELTYLASVR
jgi:hypothetical protein